MSEFLGKYLLFIMRIVENASIQYMGRMQRIWILKMLVRVVTSVVKKG
jgi:hypothetical protein